MLNISEAAKKNVVNHLCSFQSQVEPAVTMDQRGRFRTCAVFVLEIIDVAKRLFGRQVAPAAMSSMSHVRCPGSLGRTAVPCAVGILPERKREIC
jgi:hypothetical protein